MTTTYGNTAVNYQEILLAKLPHCELFHVLFGKKGVLDNSCILAILEPLG